LTERRAGALVAKRRRAAALARNSIGAA